MSGVLVQLICLLLLFVLLATAAVRDLRTRRIPNMLCLMVGALALPYWLAADPLILHRLIVQSALFGGAAVLLIALFALRILGGGDVKLIAALLLWLPPGMAATTVFLIVIAGGVVAVAMLAVTPLRRRKVAGAKVPYAVAIAMGAAPWATVSITTLAGRI